MVSSPTKRNDRSNRRQLLSDVRGSARSDSPSPAPLAAAFAVITLALLAGGFLFYRDQEREQRNNAQESLAAVSLSKVDQVSRWRQQLIGDAAVWSEDSVLVGSILRYLSAPTPAGQAALRSGLLAWKNHRAYTDIAVANPRGNVVFSLSSETGPLPHDEAGLAGSHGLNAGIRPGGTGAQPFQTSFRHLAEGKAARVVLDAAGASPW